MPKLLRIPSFRWSIASALTLSMVLVIVLLMGLVAFMDIRRERAISREALQQRSLLLASGLNDVLANYLYFSQMDSLRDIAKVVGSQPDITYVRISAADGRLLVTEPREDDQSDYPIGYAQDQFASNALRAGQAVLNFDGDSLEVASPILSATEAIGVVQFGFNVDALNAEIREIVLQHIWQGLALIAIGVVLAYLIARYASRYVGDLATAAGEMGRGDLDVLVPSKGPREVIDLAGALERMREELRAPYIGLEQRVADRTQELTVLYDISRILSEMGDFESKATRVMDRLAQSTGADWVTLRLPKEGEPGLHLVTSAGPAVAKSPPIPVFTEAQTMSSAAFTEGRTIMIEDYVALPSASQTLVELGMKSMVILPLKVEGRTLGLVTVISRDKNYFNPELVNLLTAVGEGLGALLDNARLDQQLQTSREELSVVDEVARIITSTLDIDKVYEQFATEVEKLVDADRMVINIVDEDARVYAFRYSAGMVQPDRDFPMVRPLEGTQTEAVLATGQTLIIADIASNPMFKGTERFLQMGLRSSMTVPLISQSRVLGAMTLRSQRVGAYTDREKTILERLASQIAPAVENAQLYEELKQGQEGLRNLSRQLVDVQEAERRHLARELHDEIGQVLTGLKLALEVNPRLKGDAAKANFDQAKSLVNELMGQVRELSLDLRPAMLDDLGLLPTLLWYFERFTARTQVVVDYEHTGLDSRFSPEVETTAYRIVQEALTNVARHADVTEVRVRLWSNEQVLSLLIKDDGAGSDTDDALANNRGAGLAGMRERAVLLGGQVSLESAPGAGTNLIAELPISDLNGTAKDAGGHDNHSPGG